MEVEVYGSGQVPFSRIYFLNALLGGSSAGAVFMPPSLPSGIWYSNCH